MAACEMADYYNGNHFVRLFDVKCTFRTQSILVGYSEQKWGMVHRKYLFYENDLYVDYMD